MVTKWFRFTSGFIVGLSLSCLGAPAAAQTYSVTGIASSPPGAGNSRALAVSDMGHVVGDDEGPSDDDYTGCGRANATRPFIWTAETGVVIPRPTPQLDTGSGLSFKPCGGIAFGVNDQGTMVGFLDYGSGGGFGLSRAFIWTAANGMLLIPGSSIGAAWDINNFGQVAGASGGSAFRWTATGGFESLGIAAFNSAAYAINDRGDVGGSVSQVRSLPILWNATGEVQRMDGLPYAYGQNHVTGINDNGQVVGKTFGDTLSPIFTEDRSYAFFWSPSTGALNLGDLPQDGSQSALPYTAAWGINNSEQVVGVSDSRAFLWTPAAGLRDLNTLLDQSGEGWLLMEASAINDAGQIVGFGLFQGVLRAFLLTPVTAPDPDTDDDGMPDSYEVAHGLNPNDPADADQDADADGLSNLLEFRIGSDPRFADTDGDGVSDYLEWRQTSDPIDPGSTTNLPPTMFTLFGNIDVLDGSFDETCQNNGFAHSRPTVVLTHGLSKTSELNDPLSQLWIGTGMGKATTLLHFAQSQSDSSPWNIVRFVWDGAFQVEGTLPPPLDDIIARPTRLHYFRAHQQVENASKALARQLVCLLGDHYDKEIHFVGHSLGSAVNGLAAADFLSREHQVSRAQITTLDRPHHIERITNTQYEMFWNWWGTLGLTHEEEVFIHEYGSRLPWSDESALFAHDFGFQEGWLWDALDLRAVLRDFALKGGSLRIDNYYARDLLGGLGVGDKMGGEGRYSWGVVYNHAPDPDRGLREPHEVGDTFFEDDDDCTDKDPCNEGFDNNHSGVQQWYRWTILPNDGWFTQHNNYQPICQRLPDGTAAFDNRVLDLDSSLNPCTAGWNISVLSGMNTSRFPSRNGEPINIIRRPLPIAGTIALHGCEIVDPPWGPIRCVEHSSPYLNATVDIPGDAESLSFEYRFTQVGEGDFAAVLLDDLAIWKVSASNFDGTGFIRSGPLPLGVTPGPHKLTVALYGSGDNDSAFELRGLEVSHHVPARYEFGGFGSPIANLPSVNSIRAGRVVPLKWTLHDTEGLLVVSLAAITRLASLPASCETRIPLDDNQLLQATGGTSLRYDPLSNQFVYNWKTPSEWAGTCRTLVLELDDGQKQYANFRFR